MNCFAVYLQCYIFITLDIKFYAQIEHWNLCDFFPVNWNYQIWVHQRKNHNHQRALLTFLFEKREKKTSVFIEVVLCCSSDWRQKNKNEPKTNFEKRDSSAVYTIHTNVITKSPQCQSMCDSLFRISHNAEIMMCPRTSTKEFISMLEGKR